MRRLLPCFAAAALVLAIGWWSNPGFDRLGEDDDTDDYISIAHSFSDEEVRDRPPVYPLYLRLCMRVFGDRWERAAIAGQLGMLALTAALLAGALRHRAIPSWAAVLAAAACCVTPGLLFMSGIVLPEVCLAMTLMLTWCLGIRLAEPDEPPRRIVRDALLCGFMSGIAALVKPAWTLGCLPLAAGVLLLRRREGRRALTAAAAIVAVHVALVGAWQLFLFAKYGQVTPSRMGSANINMASMRYGMTADAPGTPLYVYLDRHGLLADALRLQWKDLDEFTRIKSAIPWDFRTDPEFERAILRKEGPRFVGLQLSRMGRFFVVHPPPSDRLKFPGLPGAARRLYVHAYNGVFRIDTSRARLPVMAILLLVGFVTCLWLRPARSAGIVTVAMLVYYAAIISLLTYQDALFIRMRIAVEPELLVLAAAPFLLLLARVQGQRRGAGARAGITPPGA